jgi:hypothetical protein
MAPSRINNLNLKNSQENYNYSINFLIKYINKMNSELPYEKKLPRNFLNHVSNLYS